MTTVHGKLLKLADIEATRVDPGSSRYVWTGPGASLWGSADGPDEFQKLWTCGRGRHRRLSREKCDCRLAVTGCELSFNGFNCRKGSAFETRNLLPSKSPDYNEVRSVAEAAATYGRDKISSLPAVKILPMIGCRFAKLLAGAVLIHAAEQAYAHAYLIQFPHQGTASQNLIPASGILLALGLVLAVWGLVPERKPG